MTGRKKIFNPFYLLLAPVGALFFVTALGYGVLAFEAIHPAGLTDWSGLGDAKHPLIAWLARSGEEALLVELAALGVLTVGSIAYESVRERTDRKPE